jgi:adenine phosphoribosyltransferase
LIHLILIIAVGGSAKAGGELIQKMGGDLLGFIFILELEFLHGRDKLPAPVYTLLSGQA